MAGACRALGQGHPLGDLDDPQRSQFAGSRIEEVCPEPDELFGGCGVRDGDEDPRGEGAASRHERVSAGAVVGSGSAGALSAASIASVAVDSVALAPALRDASFQRSTR